MATTEELVARLDPERDYGPRTFEQVQDEIARGLIVIEPGHSLPILRDASTNRAIKGTGRPAGQTAQEWSRAFVRNFLTEKEEGSENDSRIEDLVRAAYAAVVGKGDMKALELLVKYGIGDHREIGADAGSQAVAALYELASKAGTTRRIEIDQK